MRRSIGLAASAVLVLTGAALACPVCYDAGNPHVAETYRRSTMMLSLLPFGIVGSVAAVARHFVTRDRPTDGASADPAPTTR